MADSHLNLFRPELSGVRNSAEFERNIRAFQIYLKRFTGAVFPNDYESFRDYLLKRPEDFREGFEWLRTCKSVDEQTRDKLADILTLLIGTKQFEAMKHAMNATTAQGKTVPHKIQAEAIQPSRNALFFLYLFLEKKGREEAVGDALEEYSRYIKRVGKLRADILFYQEVGRCAWPFIKRTVAKIGGLVVISEWLRKLTH